MVKGNELGNEYIDLKSSQLGILPQRPNFSLSDCFLAINNKSNDNDVDVNELALISYVCSLF
jgi:hypothetical protein